MDPLERSEKILRASLDPVFFAQDPYFLGISTLYPKQIEILRAFYEGRYHELVLIAGMRSGKTFLSSVFATYELFNLIIHPEPAIHFGLARGSKLFINCVAPSEEQGMDTVFAELQGRIVYSPFFQEFEPKIHQADIVFPREVMLRVLPSTSASQAGRTAKAVVLDELDRFEETAGKRGAWAVYNTVSRSIRTLGSAGHIISITSPLHEKSIAMQLYRKKLYNMMCLKVPTWDFNPNITRESLQDEFEKDPVAAMRDYGCEPFESISPYYSNPEIINAIERPNVLELLAEGIPVGDKTNAYVMGCDPAVKHDAFGISLMHTDGGHIFADGLFSFRPRGKLEINPIDVAAFLSKVCENFSVRYAIFDYPMYPELMELLRMKGVEVLQHVARKEDHDRVKEMFYRKTLSIPQYPKAIEEFKGLEIIDARKVDHPRGGSKDVIDTIATGTWAINEYLMRPHAAFNMVRTF